MAPSEEKGESQRQLLLDGYRGHYLCEVCEEAMTDEVLPAAESPTGQEMVMCPYCQSHLRRA